LRARLRSQTMRINELEERSYSLEVVLQAALHHLDCKFIISHDDAPTTLH
jgi:hypothetical protein